ncbi:MAG: hypothetical protein ACP5JU_01775 [Minisyncoccia bacterium]
MGKFLEFLPKKLFLTLILIIILFYFGSWGLNYLTNFNNKKVEEINKNVDELSAEYQKEVLGQDVYKSVIHFIALDYLIKTKRNVSPILTRINLYLPKNLKVNSISIDMNKNEISLNSSVPDWLEYAKVVKYFNSSKEFPDSKITNVSFDKEKYLINFTVTFKISQSLLQ